MVLPRVSLHCFGRWSLLKQHICMPNSQVLSFLCQSVVTVAFAFLFHLHGACSILLWNILPETRHTNQLRNSPVSLIPGTVDRKGAWFRGDHGSVDSLNSDIDSKVLMVLVFKSPMPLLTKISVNLAYLWSPCLMRPQEHISGGPHTDGLAPVQLSSSLKSLILSDCYWGPVQVTVTSYCCRNLLTALSRLCLGGKGMNRYNVRGS